MVFYINNMIFSHKDDDVIFVSISDLLKFTKWDDHHRSIMSGFIKAGVYSIKLKRSGSGDYVVLNYPSIIKTP